MKKQVAARKVFAIVALSGLFAAPVFAAAETFVVDPNHTYPRFEYSHLGYSKQIQRFNKTSGTIVVDRAAKTGAVDISIDARSVDTGYPLFDEHIQGEDYFDTANYPTITYKSTAVKFEDDIAGVRRRSADHQGGDQAGDPDRHFVSRHAAPDAQEGRHRRQCRRPRSNVPTSTPARTRLT
jgi:hypothetical protein